MNIKADGGQGEGAKDGGEADKGAKHGQADRGLVGTGKGRNDAFAAAFNKAADELEGKKAGKDSAKVSREQKAPKLSREQSAELDDDEEDNEKDDSAVASRKDKPVARDKDKSSDKAKNARKADVDDDEEDEEDGENEDEDNADKTAKAKPADKSAPKPKDWWSRERRESFAYQTKEVQDAWLAERPSAPQHWPQNFRETFAKQPAEVQEAWLLQHQEMARGLDSKMQGLANERKLAEGIRKAVPEQLRAYMKSKGLDEVGVFTILLQHQDKSMKDPVSYVREFILNNKLNPLTVLGLEKDETGELKRVNGSQADAKIEDISANPVVVEMRRELDRLKAERLEESRLRAEENDRRISSELDAVLQKKDSAGNPAYPLARVLAGQIANIIQADPEQFRSMGAGQRFEVAYKLATEQFPELASFAPPKKDKKADESSNPNDEADGEEEEDDEEERRRQRAATKKSKQPVKGSRASSDDPFDRAFNKAARKTGLA